MLPTCSDYEIFSCGAVNQETVGREPVVNSVKFSGAS